ncbi:L-type lectin-domain containing receptor kinase V.9-like [Bidens hawaiensis]|uniref:L-type lectin-domain containing receptor kinase V.9-like n=1 Tax=Bidens hawaiensis TaxID=980011 RepID=UPI0040499DCF
MSGVGHTFYSRPFRFKPSPSGSAVSFATSFVFGIVPDDPRYTFHGMTFAIAPSKDVIDASSSQHLGLFNRTNDGNSSNHVVALELDTFKNLELADIDSNHIGLDINSVVSVFAATAGYYNDETGEFVNLTLASSQRIRAWIEYDGVLKQLNVTVSPLHLKKPKKPLASLHKDLSPYLLEQMFVGFTSATGVLLEKFYVLAWSFKMNGKPDEIDVSSVPALPVKAKSNKRKHLIIILGASVSALLIITSASIVGVFLYIKRKRKFAEVLEGWEVQYGPHRFSYKDLYKATKGFKESELLGKGGFGQVYKGTLPELGAQVAVKKVWHESGQGMKEFVAEIATIGRLRHPNLVRLLGYCRRKGELFLVYDYMPNLSLDSLLFNSNSSMILTWKQRVKIITGVAEALAYLHEEWVEVIIHRDVKASNVLLDADLNAKLGDFGLARFSDNGNEAKTTHLAGTLGYIAPELARKGKATTATDIFAFGAFCLEVVCGRRPVEVKGRQEAVILVDWVLDCWFKGELLKTVDPKLEQEMDAEEMGLVLKIGLLCSHSVAAVRPSMSQVLRFLRKQEPLPEDFDTVLDIREDYSGRLGDASSSAYFSQIQYSTASLPATESFLSSGR